MSTVLSTPSLARDSSSSESGRRYWVSTTPVQGHYTLHLRDGIESDMPGNPAYVALKEHFTRSYLARCVPFVIMNYSNAQRLLDSISGSDGLTIFKSKPLCGAKLLASYLQYKCFPDSLIQDSKSRPIPSADSIWPIVNDIRFTDDESDESAVVVGRIVADTAIHVLDVVDLCAQYALFARLENYPESSPLLQGLGSSKTHVLHLPFTPIVLRFLSELLVINMTADPFKRSIHPIGLGFLLADAIRRRKPGMVLKPYRLGNILRPHVTLTGTIKTWVMEDPEVRTTFAIELVSIMRLNLQGFSAREVVTALAVEGISRGSVNLDPVLNLLKDHGQLCCHDGQVAVTWHNTSKPYVHGGMRWLRHASGKGCV